MLDLRLQTAKMYGYLEAWFQLTFKLGEITPVDKKGQNEISLIRRLLYSYCASAHGVTIVLSFLVIHTSVSLATVYGRGIQLQVMHDLIQWFVILF